MSYRVGKKNSSFNKATFKKRALFPDIVLFRTDKDYRVLCECGRYAHVSAININLLRTGGQPRYTCQCGRNYNIADTNNVIEPVVPKLPNPHRINKELAVKILKSGLPIDECAIKFGINRQNVVRVFKKRNKYLNL